MNWHFEVNRKPVGPIAEVDLVAKIHAGEVLPDCRVWNPTLTGWIRAGSSALASHFPATPPPLPQADSPAPSASVPANLLHGVEQFTDKVVEDVRELLPQFLLPFREFRRFGWIHDRSLLLVAGFGLFPLAALILFGEDLKSAYWALALYFSIAWAFFLYRVFPAHQASAKHALFCFFGTGIASMTLLQLAYVLPPLNGLLRMAQTPTIGDRFLGMLLGVAVPEELCKALVLFVLVKTSFKTQAVSPLLFCGLMSGLGFGVYEGVDYQTGRNVLYARSVGEMYLLNVLRLTSLPFLHAMWTGIAGYFIGLSTVYPRRKRGLLLGAICIPALLHALHNTFSDSLIALVVGMLSVMTVIVYVRMGTQVTGLNHQTESDVADSQRVLEPQGSISLAKDTEPPTEQSKTQD